GSARSARPPRLAGPFGRDLPRPRTADDRGYGDSPLGEERRLAPHGWRGTFRPVSVHPNVAPAGRARRRAGLRATRGRQRADDRNARSRRFGYAGARKRARDPDPQSVRSAPRRAATKRTKRRATRWSLRPPLRGPRWHLP